MKPEKSSMRYMFSVVRERLRSHPRPYLDFAFGRHQDPVPAEILEFVRSHPDLAARRCSAEEMEQLRDAAAAMLERTYGVSASPEAVLPAPGGRAAMVAMLACLLERGDDVLVTEPGYPAFARVAGQLGATIRPVRLDPARGFAPDSDGVTEGAARSLRVVALNYPNNPTGAVPTDETLAEVAERFGPRTVWFNDDTYGPLTFEGSPFSLLARREVRLGAAPALELHSLGKLFALGPLSIAFLAGDPRLVRLVRDFSEFAWSPLSALQAQAARLCLEADGHVRDVRDGMRERRDRLQSVLESLGFEPYPAQGGNYLLCRVPSTIGGRAVAGADEAAEVLLAEHDLSVVPFEVPPHRYLRFALTYVEDDLESLGKSGGGGKLVRG